MGRLDGGETVKWDLAITEFMKGWKVVRANPGKVVDHFRKALLVNIVKCHELRSADIGDEKEKAETKEEKDEKEKQITECLEKAAYFRRY